MGCHNSFFFFPPIFSPNLLFFSNFGNLVATIFSPLIYGNFIAKITIKFPPLQFRQLGCHNSIFSLSSLSYNFSNLVAMIGFFSFEHFSFGHFIWVVDFGSNNFGNLITEIQNFFLTPTITSFISPLLYFLLEFRQRCY